MKIHLRRASSEWVEIRDIETLSDIVNLLKEFRCGLLISSDVADYHDGSELDVLIYDGYIE